MDLLELAERFPEISITMKAADLLEVIEKTVERAKAEFAPVEAEKFLTVAETARMLGIDRSSLWRWNKHNYLIPIEVGGKRKYKLSEVKRILEGNGNLSNITDAKLEQITNK